MIYFVLGEGKTIASCGAVGFPFEVSPQLRKVQPTNHEAEERGLLIDDYTLAMKCFGVV